MCGFRSIKRRHIQPVVQGLHLRKRFANKNQYEVDKWDRSTQYCGISQVWQVGALLERMLQLDPTQRPSYHEVHDMLHSLPQDLGAVLEVTTGPANPYRDYIT